MEPKLHVLQTTPLPLRKVGYRRLNLGKCELCEQFFLTIATRHQRFCSRSCSGKAKWAGFSPEKRQRISKASSAALMGRPSYNKGIACRPETKAKLSAAHRATGHRPKERGGNGKIAPCEQMMFEMLSNRWIYQWAVATGQKRGTGFPTAYKMDFADPKRKLNLEVDGNSHTSRGHLDVKRDTFLVSLGWSVSRVTNQQVQAWYTTFKSTGRIPTQLKACLSTIARHSSITQASAPKRSPRPLVNSSSVASCQAAPTPTGSVTCGTR